SSSSSWKALARSGISISRCVATQRASPVNGRPASVKARNPQRSSPDSTPSRADEALSMPVALPDELRPPLFPGEALVEADRCLACGETHADAPCMLACPAGVDVPAFVEALAGGDTDEASRTILARNLLGASCARVCPVEVLCQAA